MTIWKQRRESSNGFADDHVERRRSSTRIPYSWSSLRFISLVVLCILGLLLLSLIFAAIGVYWTYMANKEKYSPYCRDDQYICKGNNACLDINKLCDSEVDCPQGEDESSKFGCDNSTCRSNELECAVGICVSNVGKNPYAACPFDKNPYFTAVSFALQDCTDKTLYFNCGKLIAEGCIPYKYVCDGVIQCPNGSDEYNCTVPIITRPPVPAIYAYNGDNFTLTCTASGKPRPMIKWHYDFGHNAIPAKCAVNTTRNIGTVTCADVDESVNGKFMCQAVNHRGSHFALPFCDVVVQNMS